MMPQHNFPLLEFGEKRGRKGGKRKEFFHGRVRERKSHLCQHRPIARGRRGGRKKKKRKGRGSVFDFFSTFAAGAEGNSR